MAWHVEIVQCYSKQDLGLYSPPRRVLFFSNGPVFGRSLWVDRWRVTQGRRDVYLSWAKSLGAAHWVAQWARWKTVDGQRATLENGTVAAGHRITGGLHSSMQSSLALPSLSIWPVTRSTHSS